MVAIGLSDHVVLHFCTVVDYALATGTLPTGAVVGFDEVAYGLDTLDANNVIIDPWACVVG
jgi:hypothetical protein